MPLDIHIRSFPTRHKYQVISHSVSRGNGNGQPAFTSNDGGGFDLDGGCTSCVVEYCLSYNNSGPGFLICSFGGTRPTRNNTIRYSVSLGDGTGSANGAAGFNFYTPDSLVDIKMIGNTLIGTGPNVPVLGPTPYGKAATGLFAVHNAILSLGSPSPAPLASFPARQMPSGLQLDGNEWWAAPGAQQWRLEWGNVTYASLQSFRASTGQESGGTDDDPALSVKGRFFASCVPWWADMPEIPNSPLLDKIRGFAGC